MRTRDARGPVPAAVLDVRTLIQDAVVEVTRILDPNRHCGIDIAEIGQVIVKLREIAANRRELPDWNPLENAIVAILDPVILAAQAVLR